jgi:hypothetical protein
MQVIKQLDERFSFKLIPNSEIWENRKKSSAREVIVFTWLSVEKILEPWESIKE